MSDGVKAGEEADAGRYCIGCGYNLRGLQSDRCPECGLPIDTAEGSAIPWEGRKEIGRFRAFRRTCWQAMFHPKRLARAVGFPVNSNSARKFRLIVALLVALPLGIAVTVWAAVERWSDFFNYLMWPGQWSWSMPVNRMPFGWDWGASWVAGVTTWGVLPVGIFVTIYLWTGVLGFWVRPGDWPVERRDRATAASAYASAPLVLMIVPTILQIIAYSLWDVTGQFYWRICVLCLAIAYAGVLLIVAIYLSSALNLISATTHSSLRRWAAAWVQLPACWVLSAVIGLGFFPLLLGLIRIMVQSVMR